MAKKERQKAALRAEVPAEFRNLDEAADARRLMETLDFRDSFPCMPFAKERPKSAGSHWRTAAPLLRPQLGLVGRQASNARTSVRKKKSETACVLMMESKGNGVNACILATSLQCDAANGRVSRGLAEWKVGTLQELTRRALGLSKPLPGGHRSKALLAWQQDNLSITQRRDCHDLLCVTACLHGANPDGSARHWRWLALRDSIPNETQQQLDAATAFGKEVNNSGSAPWWQFLNDTTQFQMKALPPPSRRGLEEADARQNSARFSDAERTMLPHSSR